MNHKKGERFERAVSHATLFTRAALQKRENRVGSHTIPKTLVAPQLALVVKGMSRESEELERRLGLGV